MEPQGFASSREAFSVYHDISGCWEAMRLRIAAQ